MPAVVGAAHQDNASLLQVADQPLGGEAHPGILSMMDAALAVIPRRMGKGSGDIDCRVAEPMPPGSSPACRHCWQACQQADRHQPQAGNHRG